MTAWRLFDAPDLKYCPATPASAGVAYQLGWIKLQVGSTSTVTYRVSVQPALPPPCCASTS